MMRRSLHAAVAAAALAGALLGAFAASPPSSLSEAPDILIVTVDTLRYDHLGVDGDPRPITPHLDRLLSSGVRFAQARTVEPLTSPAICSLFTSLQPHEHGSTRNGLRMHGGLASLPLALQDAGWQTAAFVSNWTLRDKLSGLGKHFQSYHELLSEKRWFGMVRGEASAPGLTTAVLEWVAQQPAGGHRRPLLLWVHYSDPHAPYEMHEEHAAILGTRDKGSWTARERYATEVAWTDAAIGQLLAGLPEAGLSRNLMVVFSADHGESLGENDYWGHGNNLREAGLRIPMGVAWPGHVEPRVVSQPALITDLAPTILGLLGLESPGRFGGFDWASVMRGAAPPASRVTYYQVHRGAVMARHGSESARRSGLLEVASIMRGRKEILSLNGPLSVFDLRRDPSELSPQPAGGAASNGLSRWLRRVQSTLTVEGAGADDASLSDEDLEKLKSLGYLD